MTDRSHHMLPQPSGTELRALDEYIDTLAGGGGVSIDLGLLGADGPGLAALVDKLGTLPDVAWDDVASLFAAPGGAPVPAVAPAPATGRRAGGRHRTAGRLSRRAGRLSGAGILVAAAVLVVVAGALAITTLSGQPPPRPGTGATVVPASWRLAGFIDQPAWQAGGSAATVGVAPAVTCPGGSVCYADEPGSSQGAGLVEVTADGGSTWEASPLPAGWQVTSALTCTTTASCLAGGDTAVAAASAAPAGGTPAILATADGGSTWSEQPLPSGVAEVTNLACASPADCVGAGDGPSTTASSVGPPVAVVTTDGGSSWTVVALPGPFVADSPEGLACPTARSCVLVGATAFATSGSSAGILYSTDGGQRWSPAVVPAALDRARAVSCTAVAHCVALGNGPPSTSSASGPYGPSEALTSTDGGRTWSLAGPAGSVPAFLTSISCATAVDCWAGGRLAASSSGTIVVTRDAGASWTTVRLPTTPSPAQQEATRLLHLDVENVSSVSCPAAGDCVALGAQYSLSSTEQQIVLWEDGP